MGWTLDKKFFHDDFKKGKCYDDEDEDDDYGSQVSVRSMAKRPDGGWGWVVLIAAFTLNMIVDGIGVTFGVQAERYMEFFNATNSQVTVIGSSLTGCYLIIGPVAGMMCYHLGLRKVTMLGSVIAATGFITSSQVTNVELLIITYGVIGGIGLGMMYLPSIVCVSYWFDKRLGLATGFAVCGSGLGQYVFYSLSEYLLNEYGWHGKHLIFGAIALHGIVCGLIFRSPTHWQHRTHKQCQKRVEIERGAIMKALIEDKKRQRTISDGSLDNCVITTNNQLIKIQPMMFQGKTKALRKMLRGLGFSIQSLAVSKSSLQHTTDQRILMEALQQQQQQQQQQQNKSDNQSMKSAANSKVQIHSPLTGQLPKRNSSPDLNKVSAVDPQPAPVSGFISRSNSVHSNHKTTATVLNSNTSPVSTPLPIVSALPKFGVKGNGYTSSGTSTPVKKFPKTKSCEVLAQQVLIKKLMSERVRCNSECTGQSSTNNGNTASLVFPLSSTPAIPCCDGNFAISIQEIPPSEAASCCASNTSIATDASSQFTTEYHPNSSRNSYLCRLSNEQLEVINCQLAEQKPEEKSFFYRMWDMAKELFQLMGRPVFTLFLMSSFFTLVAYYIPFFYISELGSALANTMESPTYFNAVISISSTIGRLIVGWLGDRPKFNSLLFNNLSLLAAGILCFVAPLCQQPYQLLFLCIFLGLCLATFMALRSVLLVKILGVEIIPKTFGLMCLVMGVGVFSGIPLSGMLVDATGSVKYTFFVAGGFLISSGLIMSPVSYLKRREDARLAQDETDTESCYLDSASGYASPVHSRV